MPLRIILELCQKLSWQLATERLPPLHLADRDPGILLGGDEILSIRLHFVDFGEQVLSAASCRLSLDYQELSSCSLIALRSSRALLSPPRATPPAGPDL
jgi:hypothetical protein